MKVSEPAEAGLGPRISADNLAGSGPKPKLCPPEGLFCALLAAVPAPARTFHDEVDLGTGPPRGGPEGRPYRSTFASDSALMQ